MSVRAALIVALSLSSACLAFPASIASASPDQASCSALREGDKEFVRVNGHANALVRRIPAESDRDEQTSLLSQIADDYRSMAEGLQKTAGEIPDPKLKEAVLSTKQALLRYAESSDDYITAKGDVPDSAVENAEADIAIAKRTYRGALESCGLPSA